MAKREKLSYDHGLANGAAWRAALQAVVAVDGVTSMWKILGFETTRVGENGEVVVEEDLKIGLGNAWEMIVTIRTWTEASHLPPALHKLRKLLRDSEFTGTPWGDEMRGGTARMPILGAMLFGGKPSPDRGHTGCWSTFATVTSIN
ncbi:hypothetical protein HDV00_008948 [Rhizophlyctis rosea]|nr:hypothetical protein HDV00_008948 [Rhizophlyctis rosea]